MLLLDYSVDAGALQVKDAEHSLRACVSDHVLHNDEPDWPLVLHLDRVDAVDAGQQARWVVLHALKVGTLDPEEGPEVCLTHCLDQKSLVTAAEDEAA